MVLLFIVFNDWWAVNTVPKSIVVFVFLFNVNVPTIEPFIVNVTVVSLTVGMVGLLRITALPDEAFQSDCTFSLIVMFPEPTNDVLFIVFNVWCSVRTVPKSTTPEVPLEVLFIVIPVMVPTFDVFEFQFDISDWVIALI